MSLDLKAVRMAAEMTQRDIADNLGLAGEGRASSGRVAVAQMEARTDWLVSRIKSFIEAAGGSAELIVKVNGEELRFDL